MFIKPNSVYNSAKRENPHLCKASEVQHLVSLCCAVPKLVEKLNYIKQHYLPLYQGILQRPNDTGQFKWTHF